MKSKQLLFVLLLLAVGCGPLTEPRNPDVKIDDKAPVVLERAPVEEIWIALAHAVEAGKISNAYRLNQVVDRLLKNGDLTVANTTSFNDAFGDAIKANRKLTKDDAKTIRGLK